MAIELVCSCGRRLHFDVPPAQGKASCPQCGKVQFFDNDRPTDFSAATKAGNESIDPPVVSGPKPLWAVMGKAASPIDSQPPTDSTASALKPTARTESETTSNSTTSASGPNRKGLWGLMQSPSSAIHSSAPSTHPSEAPRPIAEVFVPAISESDLASAPPPMISETADVDLAALFGVHPHEPAVSAAGRSAQNRRGTSRKAIVAVCLGGLSIPLAFLALIDEFWTRFPATLVGFAAILLGMLAYSEIQHSAGRQTGKRLAIAGMMAGIVGVFLGPLVLTGIGRRLWQQSARGVTEGHLKTIGQALEQFDAAQGVFPPGGIFKLDRDKHQRGFHGWMTLLLPYLGEEDLYRKINLDVPFDDTANRAAFREDAEVFFAFGSERSKVQGRFGASHFAGVGGDVENPEGGVFHAGLFGINSRVTRDDVTDGLANTLAAGEIADDFPAWGDPDNRRVIGKGLNRETQAFGNHDRTGASFLMADGSVRFFSNKTSVRVLTALSTRDGGE